MALIRPGGTWTTLTDSDRWVEYLTCCDIIFDISGKWVYIGYQGMVVRADLMGRVLEKVVKRCKAFSGGDLLMVSGIGDTKAFTGHHSSTMLVGVGRGFQGAEMTDCVYYYRRGSYDSITRNFNLKDGFQQLNVTNGLPRDCYDSEFHPLWILPYKLGLYFLYRGIVQTSTLYLSDNNVDWLLLPDDILTLILSKYLDTSQDYIRFSVVCKHWHSVVKAGKQNHMATRKQIPFLLLPTITEDLWSLYNVAQDRFLDSTLRVQVPRRCKGICGSSHGWLIFDGYDDHDDSIITLFSPFTQAQISLPPIPYESNNRNYVTKVILSADPTLHPNDYIVAACTINASEYGMALIQPSRGDRRWTTLKHPDCRADEYFKCTDIIFDESGKWVYAIGFNGMVIVRVDLEGRVLETVVQTGTYHGDGCLGGVSSGSGELLMFTGVLYGDEVQMWKLQGSSFVQVDHLVGDTAVFLGKYSSTTLVGRGFQGVETDGVVYYYRPDSYDILRKFNLKDGKFDRHSVTDDMPSYCSDIRFHHVWILPSVNL